MAIFHDNISLHVEDRECIYLKGLSSIAKIDVCTADAEFVLPLFYSPE